MCNKITKLIVVIFLLIIINTSLFTTTAGKTDLKIDDLEEGTHFWITSVIPPQYKLIFDRFKSEGKDTSPFEIYYQYESTNTDYLGKYSHYNVSIDSIQNVTDRTNPYQGSIFDSNQTIIGVNQEISNKGTVESNYLQTFYSQSTLNGWWKISQQTFKSAQIRLNQFIQLMSFNNTEDINAFINPVRNIFLDDNYTSKALIENYGYPYFNNFNESYIQLLYNQTLKDFHDLYDFNPHINVYDKSYDQASRVRDFSTGLGMHSHIKVGNYDVELYSDTGTFIKINPTTLFLDYLFIYCYSNVLLTNRLDPDEARFAFGNSIEMEFYRGIVNFTDIATYGNNPVPTFPLYFVIFEIILLVIGKKYTRQNRAI